MSVKAPEAMRHLRIAEETSPIHLGHFMGLVSAYVNHPDNVKPRTVIDWALAAVVAALVVLRLAVGLRDAREGRFTPTVLTPGEMPR